MESETGNVQQIMMLPPPPRKFNDREELIAYVRDFAVNHGYVVTIKNSKRESDVTLSCDRGGTTRKRNIGEPKRKRKVPSRLINCPFEVVGRKDDDVWVLRIKNGNHNHEPLKDMSEHPYSRRFSEDEMRQIKEMVEAGAKPREVLETLKKSNPEIQSTTRDVYNLKTKISRGKFSETSFKSWKPFTGSSSTRINPLKVSNFIGGKFVNSEGNVFVDVVNPATQEVVSQVPSTTYEEFKSAVFAAKQACRSWRNTPFSARQRIIVKLSELIRRDIDKLALVISTEQGETIKRAHSGILHSLEVVEHACGNRALHMGECVPNASTGIDMHSIREPLGVCAGICQFNYPALVSLWMFPISIICGNTFVLRPSEKHPGASLKLVELAVEAGLPDGVLNIVHGGNEIVDYICGDDDIKAISFVGCHTTAMRIYAQAAARGKRIEVNIRSKNQAVVMPDACMDTTLDALVAAGFGSAGDPCMSLCSVIFVGCSSSWVEELIKRARELKVYEGTDESADMGPVISEEVKARICRSVQHAVEGGARLILDGRNIMVPGYEKGSFVGPTILSGITPSMEWFEEDLLGPLLLCTQVNSLEEAIATLNQQKARTGASIFTTSGFAAKKFQNEVEVGLVGVNVPLSIPLPFCSTGLSTSFVGNLNFYGKAGVQFYTQVKLVAQQWRGLTNKRISSTGTLSIHQAVPMSIRLSPDLSSEESSSSMSESSDTEVSAFVSQAPDINLSLPQTSKRPKTLPSTSQGTNDVLQCPERDSIPLMARTSEVTEMAARISYSMPLPTPQNDDGTHCSYLPTTSSHIFSTRGCTLALSHGNEDVRTSSQQRDSDIHLLPERASMSASRGVDGFAIHFSGEREFIPVISQTQAQAQAHWNGDVIPSLMMNNGSSGQSTSERAYIQMASQRMESVFQSFGTNKVNPAADTHRD
ncbi:methylmalonate-semialdehyde dehydrogenase [acylating], mitochondrial-like isoform X1 [Silene latifolia]|uniref:methylmalonate-semialdehyde dehydrogenase [acylating], mitochondrial-like isoform X1 n=1 Tax=Silene latifolia TaxID=37657 RepID=UPI003D7848F7